MVAWILVARMDGLLRGAGDAAVRGVHIIFLCPTLKQFKDAHAAAILEELGGKWAALGGKINRSNWSISFPGGSTVRVFPAREYSAQVGRGMRCDVVLSDEIDDIATSTYDSVCSPWLSAVWSLGLEVFSGTPRKGRGGLLWRNYSQGQEGDRIRSGLVLATSETEVLRRRYSYHATWRDCPDQVDPEAVAQHRASVPLAVHLREYECDFDSAEGLIYSMFDPSFHVRSPPNQGAFRTHVCGLDFGWAHPQCLLWIGIIGDGPSATAWILGEWYESDVSDDVWSERCKAWSFATKTYCDPSQPSKIDALRKVCRAEKADNAVQHGLSLIATLLTKRTAPDGTTYARLYVSPSCKNLIREMGLYRRKRDPHQADAFLEAPEKINDDACLVAGTMISTSRGQVPIEDVRPGDLVETRGGLSPVLWSGLTGRNVDVWTLSTDVSEIRGTGSHTVYSGDEFVRIDALRHGAPCLTNMDPPRPSGMPGTTIEDAALPSGAIGISSRAHAPALVLGSSPSGTADIYNLVVDGDFHEFFANGILVHNCDAMRYGLLGHFGRPSGPKAVVSR